MGEPEKGEIRPFGDGTPMDSKWTQTLRFVYTTNICISYFAGGIIFSQIGPSMVDLRYLLNGNTAKEIATLKSVSLVLTFLSAGCFTGGTVAFLYKWSLTSPYINRQLISSIFLLILGFFIGLLPQIRHLSLLYTLTFLSFIAMGHLTATAITWIIEMWSGRVLAALMQAFQLSFGLGTIVGPLLTRPYLYGYLNETLLQQMNESQYWAVIRERRNSLTVPFAVSGTFLGLVGLSMFILFIIPLTRYRVSGHKTTTPTAETAENEPTSKPLELAGNQTRLRLYLIFTVFTFIFANLIEFSLSTFLDVFLQSLPALSVSAPQAATVSAFYATAYTLGRAASIAISMLLSPGHMLTLHLTLSIIGLIGLFWTITLNLGWITGNALLLGYAFSATIPSLFTFTALNSRVNDRLNALFSMAIHLPSIFTPFIIGPQLEASPHFLLYYSTSGAALAFGLFLIIRYALIPKGNNKQNTSF